MQIRDVFQKHRLLLQRVFSYYSKPEQEHLRTSAAGTSLNINDFLRLLRDCQALDKGLTPLAVKHLFAHTQLEEAFLDDTTIGGGEDDMIYSEFLEGIAAVALYKYCSSYVSISRRIDNFINHYIKAKARGVQKR